jgi:hypothetical protein
MNNEMTGKLKSIWQNAGLVEVLSSYLPDGTEENNGKPQVS